MPRLAKIRLTGCRYDGLQKEHENSIFDLTKGDQADHSLFTLCNGGGKGVMMQLIFQILLPKTRWGKNNGNKVISMFYDRRNNLHPFTFHVVLEWILDTIPQKRLITGIAVKAEIKNTSSEDENKTGLSYFLYTHERVEGGYFSVENLPLYDKTTNQAVEIDILDEFITSNRRDFIRYSKSSVSRIDSDYYNYLENRGIYRSEWLNLKAINKSEGGAGDYFIGAGDNKSIFDKKIIPVISENIKNYSFDDGDNLLEMFRSNLSITKDLPILIKREADYKELLVEIKPLIQNALIGSGFSDIKDRLVHEGNDIYFILKDQALFIDREIVKWEAESLKTKDQRKDLQYKKDNLHYNKASRNLLSKESQAYNLDKKEKQIIGQIDQEKEEKLLYGINKVYYYRKKVENEIENKSIEKEKLIEALGLSDIRSKAEELDYEIELEFEKTKDLWIGLENQYSAYINYTDTIKEENKDKKKKYLDKMESLSKKDNIFLIKEEELVKEKKKLEEIYDILSLSFPERIAEDLREIKKDTEEKHDRLSLQINKYNKNISQIDIDKAKLDYQIENKDKSIESLNKRASQQEKVELEISRMIAKTLMEKVEAGLLTEGYFKKKLEKLENMKIDKGSRLQAIQRKIWVSNIDRQLNKEDYFVANKDMILIKEEIKRLDINVLTGTEYLNEIDPEDKKDILARNPGFIYSLLIASQSDWEIIRKNISEDLFINNMLPIYIRSQMKDSKHEGFKTLKNKAYSLIDKELYLDWKFQIEDTIESLKQTENSLKEDLSKIDTLTQEIKIIMLKDTSIVLGQNIKTQKEEKIELLEKIRLLQEEKSIMDNKMRESKEALKKNSDRSLENASNMEKINTYIEKTKELEEDKVEILPIRKEIKEIKEDILILDQDSQSISSNQDLIRDSYWKWKTSIENTMAEVKELYKDFSYHYKVNKDYANHRIPDFKLGHEGLKSLLAQRRLIEKDISAKNTSIAVLDTEIKNLAKDRSRHIEELEFLSENWIQYPCLDLSLNEINIQINALEKSLKILQEEKIKTRSQVDLINGKIDMMKEQLVEKQVSIEKAHARSPLILEIKDIDGAINQTERDIESSEKHLIRCQEVLERNTSKKMKFQINLSKIKNGYSLELDKGKTDKILKDKLKENPDLIVDQWLRSCENNERKIKETLDAGERLKIRFIKEVEITLVENRLRGQISSTINDINIFNFKKNKESFEGMESHFQKEILSLSKDKDKAEKAMKQWTDRASMHVIKMIESLKAMVNSMNYINEEGHAFPLVKLKGIERLPKEKSEISHLLDEYFIQSISEVLESKNDIFNISDQDLKELMGDKEIFSKALQGRYPTLMVYKMSEKNEFRYARPREEYYTTWEAINKGEGDLPEGSGGQTLSVNTFVIMMIMSFKKKHLGNENPSTVLILDNPFGKASAKHVLDPIFEIADRLNFQLICFAAPEIIKVEISERFPVFWELKIEEGKVVHGGRVIK